MRPSLHCVVACLALCASPVLEKRALAGGEDYLSKDELLAAGLTKFWQYELPLEGRQRVVDAFLVDDAIYCTTSDGFLYALHAPTGVLRWLRPVADGATRIVRPAHVGDRLIVAAGDRVTQFNRLNGDGLLRHDLGFPVGSGVASDGERFYLGGFNHRYYAYTGVGGYEVWKIQTQARVVSRPALFEGTLFAAGYDSGVYACGAGNKSARWMNHTHGPNTADVVADSNGVYVACQDHSLYLFDPVSGEQRWRARLSGPLDEAPVATHDVVFQYCRDDGLCAIETGSVENDRRIRWVLPEGRALLTTDGKRGYVLTRGQTIVTVDLKTGKPERVVDAPGFTIGMPSPSDGTIYIAGASGRLFCARSRNAPLLQKDDLRQAFAGPTPAEPEPAAAPPAARPEVEDYLKSQRGGALIGGKSKVTRGFKEGEGPAAKPESPRPPGTGG